MAIPSAFLEDLKSRFDIEDIIGARLTLKKAGGNAVGLCPFHHEKTPSFTVNAAKQMYHCFGCGASGDVIGFLMAHDRLDFIEVVEDLAQQAGLPVPRPTGGQGDQPDIARRDTLFAVNAKAALFYQDLLQTDAGRPGRVYLEVRGITPETAAAFGLGYAPGNWQNYRPQAYANPRPLLAAGLCIQADTGRVYDRFRGRVIFPIRDRRGRVAGFGGRAIDGQEPKYLNSPETETFTKGKLVYGLWEAQTAKASQTGEAILVEGNLDVVTLHQHGFTKAVAALGTAVSAEQIERIFRLSPHIIVCMDGDKAGQQAAWRTIQTAVPLLKDGRFLSVANLPDGHDPDSYVRQHGPESLATLLSQAESLSGYVFRQLQARHGSESIESRAALFREGHELIKQLPSGTYRYMMEVALSAITKHRQTPRTKAAS